ncbi:hypothetical protein PN462_23200 [Spirulina sp. CS-785/01]|uniref:hypothetical protein n=1 Tax=Spirulina sp. CS-785/01 TaxID=3021716 RepID=UPI00232FE67D|nr:hypothetical protein [Spirulina sp. CS-785/01]MDB9316037.1 hypothetical protein [Spirulina sp. CS-785/01]
MNFNNINQSLENVLRDYQQSFLSKKFSQDSIEKDDLMLAFGLTQELKAINKQYWGRQLGACWERLVKQLCKASCNNFSLPHNSSYDLALGQDALDTKYRLGSGDSKTVRGWKANGEQLKAEGFNPILLIVRTDNLDAAIQACQVGGWEIKVGSDAYQYLENKTQFNLQTWLRERRDRFTF